MFTRYYSKYKDVLIRASALIPFIVSIMFSNSSDDWERNDFLFCKQRGRVNDTQISAILRRQFGIKCQWDTGE